MSQTEHHPTRLGASLGVFKAAHDPRNFIPEMLYCEGCGSSFDPKSHLTQCTICHWSLELIPERYDLIKE